MKYLHLSYRNARKANPISPKVFTAIMYEPFKKAEISEGINVDREHVMSSKSQKKWKYI